MWGDVMSIECYTGVPGSGKSYHVARNIYDALRSGKNVISNLNINTSIIYPRSDKRPLGNFIYVPNQQWLDSSIYEKSPLGGKVQSKSVFSYIYGLENFALQFHKRNNKGQIIEHQTLIILDECQTIFNPRSWNRKDRLKWIEFFTMHRHFGFDVILVTQNDMMIDKQIRGVLETQVLHRNVSKYKKLGKLLSLPFGGNLFICVRTMYGMSKKDSHIKSSLLFGSGFYFSLYDSYTLIK